MVFAGGRAALFAVGVLLATDVSVLVEQTEYALYFDLLKLLNKTPIVVPSNTTNNFLPSRSDYRAARPAGRSVRLHSNPCNPTGQVLQGDALREYVTDCSTLAHGALIDEAYEFFVEPSPVSSLQYVDNINSTNIFVVGAATKGLQAPGIRLGWVIASKANIATLGNYSTFAMGGVSRASQIYAEALLAPSRVAKARCAVANFYSDQRRRYERGLKGLGLSLYTGLGGFYHWCKLPDDISGDALNAELVRAKAAIVPGRHFDMSRDISIGERTGALENFFRFSFGPLSPDSFDDDLRILDAALNAATKAARLTGSYK